MPEHNQQVIAIAAASSDLDDYTLLKLPVGGETPLGQATGMASAVRFQITSSGTGASAGTLDVIFAYDTDGTTPGTGVIARYTATVTVTARRQDKDNAATGNYICDVVFAESGNSFCDVMGYGDGTNGPKVYVGMSSLGSLTTCNILTSWTRAI